MSQTPELEFIDWEEFHTMGFELAQQLSQLRPDLDTIVSISRGGHVLSRILSDLLKLPIFSLSIQSYESIQDQKELRITQELHVDLSGKHVLLVDEIVDSGKTLERALDYLQQLHAATTTSVALHVKPKASMFSDFYIAQTSKWVVYPYEVRETIEALFPIWEKAGWSQDEMKRTLMQGKFKEDHIDMFLS